ncbi:MAG: flavodoxin domain-containing protein, partial [Luteolibacter sp.]
MDSSQRAWLSGFLASAATPAVSGADTATEELMVLYGTESGNCEILADRAVKAARGLGFRARMRNMSDVKLDELPGMKRLWVIVSTWGDGEPPETSAGFYRDLMTRDLSLAGVSYSVCALGDTSYEKFCQTGKDIDKRLEELGANRILDRQDCDVDFDEPFGQWLDQALAAWSPQRVSAPVVVDVSPKTAYGKKNPYPAELIESVYLNGEGSAKETLHLEFDIDGAGLSYEPGDVLAVFPHNAPDVVE